MKSDEKIVNLYVESNSETEWRVAFYVNDKFHDAIEFDNEKDAEHACDVLLTLFKTLYPISIDTLQ